MVVSLLLADLKLDPASVWGWAPAGRSLGSELSVGATLDTRPDLRTLCTATPASSTRQPIQAVHWHHLSILPPPHSASTYLHIYISTYLRIYICLHSHLRSSVQWLLTSVWTPPGPVDKDKDINLTFHSTYNLHTAQHHSDKSQIPNLRPQTNSVE